MTDNQELQELLTKHVPTPSSHYPAAAEYAKACHGEAPPAEPMKIGVSQWTSGDNKNFMPAGKTCPSLPPACYEIQQSPQCGIYFERIPVKTEGLLRFPQTNSEKVVTEIQSFWEKEPIFRQYKLAYKRGIFLWGPPGSGKTSLVQIIMKDVIDRGGIVVKFTHPMIFAEAMRLFREIQPTTPVVVLMEDLDSLMAMFDQSMILNILDGIDQVQKCVFLATTNYPENLGPRILNRPSRFDKRFKIDHPDAESRMMYFKYIIGNDARVKELGIDLKKWVADTEKFSIAHLKELFVAVHILGDPYDEAIETLSEMRENISSSQDETGYMGFHALAKRKMTRMGGDECSPVKGY